jgi:hypothetical protein
MAIYSKMLEPCDPGGFFMGPPAHRIVDINSYPWGRGPEKLIDVELSQVHQLSK